jgi:hypothetical protein
VGVAALSNVTTGSGNIALGNGASSAITTKSNNGIFSRSAQPKANGLDRIIRHSSRRAGFYRTFPRQIKN